MGDRLTKEMLLRLKNMKTLNIFNTINGSESSKNERVRARKSTDSFINLSPA